MARKMRYFNNCVNWRRSDVFCRGGLSDMKDNSIDVTRRTFLKHVNREDLRELETEFGYAQNKRDGLTMANDYHVGYSRGKLHGQTVYFLTHSAIEYVFK